MSSDGSRPPGRPPERTRAELRAELVDAAIELLGEHGMVVDLSTVSLQDAIDRIGAPRASAYRAWSDPGSEGSPMQRFHTAVAAKLLREQPGFGPADTGAVEPTLGAVSEILDHMPPIEQLSAEERTHWLRRVIRAGGDANHHAIGESNLWRTYVAVAADLALQDDPPEVLREAWRQGEAKLATRYLHLYQAMAALFGIRLRKEYSWDQFGTATGALAEGIALRIGVNPHLEDIPRPTGPDGAPEGWSLYAVCFEALARQFFEPDPDSDARTPL